MSTATTELPEKIELGEQFEEEIHAATTALAAQPDLALVKIEDAATYQRVCSRLKEAASNIKKITEHIEPLKTKRYREWKRVCEVETRLLAPFEIVKNRDNKLVASYQVEQDRLADVEAQRQREIAKKQEEDQRAKEAEQLAEEGRVAEGVQLLDSPTIVPEPVMIAPPTPKIAGVSRASIKYKARVTNFLELIKAVAEGKAPQTLLLVNESNLNKMAATYEKGFSVPGCEVYTVAGTSVRV